MNLNQVTVPCQQLDASVAFYQALKGLAAQAGLDRDAITAYLTTDTDADLIRSADLEARQVGIEGVPFFIFNRKIGVSGAQSPEVLLQAMQQARESV